VIEEEEWSERPATGRNSGLHVMILADGLPVFLGRFKYPPRDVVAHSLQFTRTRLPLSQPSPQFRSRKLSHRRAYEQLLRDIVSGLFQQQ
jgi:hypothetical protein